jgi:hypothetical protein
MGRTTPRSWASWNRSALCWTHSALPQEQANWIKLLLTQLSEDRAINPAVKRSRQMADCGVNKISALNDLARQTFTGCQIFITPGIQALNQIDTVLRKVQQFNEFTPDNDPYGEHDFGAFQYYGETVFWKFDYFDLDLKMHSPDASDPAVTARVLTVMLANEY